MEIKVHVTAWSKAPSSRFLSTVIINRNKEFEDFITDEDDEDIVISLGSYPDSSSPPDPLIYLELANFKPDHVYQVVRSQLHDHVLSKKISDHIIVKAQQLRSRQSIDLPEESLFMVVDVKLTRKRYILEPCNSALSTTDSDQKSEEEEPEKTCAICLEDLSGRSVDNYQTPNCSHWFHENCLVKWLNRNNSCPLCRQPVYE